jgi:hypothetical protein
LIEGRAAKFGTGYPAEPFDFIDLVVLNAPTSERNKGTEPYLMKFFFDSRFLAGEWVATAGICDAVVVAKMTTHKGENMKRLFIAVILVGLLVPMGLFAVATHGPAQPPAPVTGTGGTHIFGDMFAGLGGSLYSGSYTGDDNNFPPNYVTDAAMGGSSFDFTFGGSVYWVLNPKHTYWLGIGTTLTIPLGGANSSSVPGGSITPYTLSLDIPFLYDVSPPTLSISLKASLIGVWAYDYITADNLIGLGFGISGGPVFYLDSHENTGISILAGYKYISASGKAWYTGDSMSFSGSSFSLSVCFTFIIASDNVISAETNDYDD